MNMVRKANRTEMYEIKIKCPPLHPPTLSPTLLANSSSMRGEWCVWKGAGSGRERVLILTYF